ncbi:hypothetical protein E3C22_03185 [Jiella endophytica]|uniref:Uncharacterized protein n=1 Tax=Jiella endophytica TaxID=2558362 RepID=A0A4Y8RUI9_9HYPH|nr:hypothetical protein [Jiella endophytica]TFF27477.1 hypothetical protein E3C22_03185 [Jiella endophytica]
MRLWVDSKVCHGTTRSSRSIRLCSLLLALAPLLLGSCALAPAVSDNTIAYNQAIEQSTNSLTLLNVLRSAYRMPMYFTRLGQIQGNVSADGGLTTESSFDFTRLVGLNEYSITPRLNTSFKSSPSFTVEQLDTKEFYQGILTPTDPEIFRYFWETGWPKSVLLFTLVARVDLETNVGTRCFIVNYAPRRAEYEYFSSAMRLFLGSEPEISMTKQELKDFGPEIPVTNANAILGLIEADKAKFSVPSGRRGIQLQKKDSDYKIVGTKPESNYEIVPNNRPSTGGRGKQHCREVVPDPANLKLTKAEIRFRSVQQILYALGEIVRVELGVNGDEHYLPLLPEPTRKLGIDGHWDGSFVYVPFFKVVPNGSGPISVSYRGRRFAIPDGAAAGRSNDVLALLQQLFALALKADELPRASTVVLAN